MKWDWTSLISSDELNVAKNAMLTNMVAGQNIEIPRWRYSVIGSIIYTVLRIAIYCLRHPLQEKSIDNQFNGILFLFFTPTSDNVIKLIEDNYEGKYLGFRGQASYNIPLRNIFISVIISFRSALIWRWVLDDVRWRPWISDVIIYVLVRRWSSVRFRGMQKIYFIYSNDHCCFDRGVVDPVADFGHVTIYVQHAPVTEIFPPLSAEYSLLDGEQALLTYRGINGSKGIALVCGRQYHISQIKERRNTFKSALICTSTIDTPDNWRPVIAAIKSAGYKVALRTHPSERKNRSWKGLANNLDIELIDSKQVSLSFCLEKSSIVFAGQSGVLLDSSLSGAISILVQFPQDTELGLYDYYGFAKAGVAHITCPENIWAILKELEEEEFSPLMGADFFDAAAILQRNMQKEAIDLILKGKADKSGLIASGFCPSDDNPDRDLKVFVPEEISHLISKLSLSS